MAGAGGNHRIGAFAKGNAPMTAAERQAISRGAVSHKLENAVGKKRADYIREKIAIKQEKTDTLNNQNRHQRSSSAKTTHIDEESE
jgi:hypothetical protein